MMTYEIGTNVLYKSQCWWYPGKVADRGFDDILCQAHKIILRSHRCQNSSRTHLACQWQEYYHIRRLDGVLVYVTKVLTP